MRRASRSSIACATLVALSLGACGGSPTRSGSTPGIAGDWNGTWTSTAPGLGGTGGAVAAIRQTGPSLDGQLLFIEHLCVSGLSMTGTIESDRVAMTVVGAGGERTELVGTIAADRRRMSGTYTITGGFCARSPAGRDEGTWTLAR